jgi:glycosyltransferase involved in cell wall biosynthesis
MMAMARRVVILEPELEGHHAFWLSMLIEAHRRAGWEIEVLTAADTTHLREQSRMRGYDLETGVRLGTARAADKAGLLVEARELARETGAERIFVAFLDHYWAAILAEAVGSGGAGEAKRLGGPDRAKLSGIWFHPHALDAKWRWAPPLGKRWATRGMVHRFLRSARAAEVFDTVYFLVDEPRVFLGRVNPAIRSHVLPDPYEREPKLDREAAREKFCLPQERVIFLHLGSPERRKGLPDVIEAFGQLRRERGGKTGVGGGEPLLLRVGSNAGLRAAERAKLAALVDAGWAVTVECFVPSEDLMEYFAACDWVLLPYRKFRYSSGVLANAIGAGRPVIASDYGEIGRVVRCLNGRAFPPGSAAGLKNALARATNDVRYLPKIKDLERSRSAEAFIERMVAVL